MRIGFDVTSLCVPQSGVGTYAINLLTHLTCWGEDELVLLSRLLRCMLSTRRRHPVFAHSHPGRRWKPRANVTTCRSISCST